MHLIRCIRFNVKWPANTNLKIHMGSFVQLINWSCQVQHLDNNSFSLQVMFATWGSFWVGHTPLFWIHMKHSDSKYWILLFITISLDFFEKIEREKKKVETKFFNNVDYEVYLTLILYMVQGLSKFFLYALLLY